MDVSPYFVFVAQSIYTEDRTVLAAESGRAAALDGRHDAPLQGGQRVAAALAEGRAVAPEDVRDLEPGTGHRSVGEASAAGCGRGSRSSGLVAEQTLEQATCR